MSKQQALISGRKRLLFAVFTTVVFFALLELVLLIAGIKPILATRDPFVGFANNLPLYVRHQTVDGQPMLVTAQYKRDYFNHQTFPQQKPSNSYRIFCLGGSTTFGRPYDDRTSFSGWLRELLPVADRTKNWEVINAGGISYASYRVAAVMEEVAQHQPDLFVIYTGHNEFLERRTYGELRKMPEIQRTLTAALAKTRNFALIDHLINKLCRRDERFRMPAEVDALLDHTVGPTNYVRDDQLRKQTLRHFEINLRRMIAIAHSCGAKVLLVVPACNLKDFSPFKSDYLDGMTTGKLAKFTNHIRAGKLHQRTGRLEEALKAFDDAYAIDPRNADLLFVRGQLLMQMARNEEAKAMLQQAVDEDVCSLRAVSGITEMIRDTARQFDVGVVDFEALIHKNCLDQTRHDVPGNEYFLDHVHPTIATNRMLGVALIDYLIDDGTVRPNADWNPQAVGRVAVKVHSSIDEMAHAIALRNLAKVLIWAGKRHEGGRLALKALRTIPEDVESLFFADIYLQQLRRERQAGRGENGLPEPEVNRARRLVATALVQAGKLKRAQRHLEDILVQTPDDEKARLLMDEVRRELGLETSFNGKPN